MNPRNINPHNDAKEASGVTSDQLDRIIYELLSRTDEISGAPIDLGDEEVWIHTVSQVRQWLKRFLA